MAKKAAVMDQELETTQDDEGQDEIVTSGTGKLCRIEVTIRGLPPGLLMSSKNGMVPETERGKQVKVRTREEQAADACYWTKVGKKSQLALPWINLYKALVSGAKRFKFKGNEKMTKLVAATISCETDMIPLGTDQYEIDSRWGRIPPKTGGVVMLNRALLRQWSATFVLVVDDEFYPAEKLEEVLRTAGKLAGVCANRPELEGPHGKFVVEKWDPLD